MQNKLQRRRWSSLRIYWLEEQMEKQYCTYSVSDACNNDILQCSWLFLKSWDLYSMEQLISNAFSERWTCTGKLSAKNLFLEIQFDKDNDFNHKRIFHWVTNQERSINHQYVSARNWIIFSQFSFYTHQLYLTMKNFETRLNFYKHHFSMMS